MHKISIILCLITWMNYLVGIQELPMQMNRPFNLLTSDGKPSQPLLELLNLLAIEHDDSLKNIVEITQKNWLRKPGAERWHMKDIYQEKHAKIFPLLDKIGVLKEIKPSKQSYDYLLFYGASLGRMQKRLSTLWKHGVTFKAFIFFTGDRPLDLKIEPIKDLFYNKKHPVTEYEAGRALFSQAQTPLQLLNAPLYVITEQHTEIPEKDELKIIFVDTPMKGSQRPTTADTVTLWLKSNPKPGSCLVTSSQPYVGYQDTIASLLIPKTFDIETVGSSSIEQNIAVHLDNLARWLYVELSKAHTP